MTFPRLAPETWADMQASPTAVTVETPGTTATSNPLPGQVLRRAAVMFQDSDNFAEPELADERPVANLANANLLTSEVDVSDYSQLTRELIERDGGPLHRPVLDIDIPTQLIPSGRPGHYHLIIERSMNWDHYVELLGVLVKTGIIEEGFASAAKRRGYSAVRLPGIEKHALGRPHHHPGAADKLPVSAGLIFEPADAAANTVCRCLHDDPDVDGVTAA